MFVTILPREVLLIYWVQLGRVLGSSNKILWMKVTYQLSAQKVESVSRVQVSAKFVVLFRNLFITFWKGMKQFLLHTQIIG